MINFAKFRHRITFQTFTEIVDEGGGRTVAWKDFKTFWASVQTVSGSEVYRHNKLNTETTHVIEMRYTSEIKNNMRIVFRGMTFEILSVIDPDGSKKKLIIEAKNESKN